MRYRTKLTLILVGLVICSNAALAGLLYYHSRAALLDALSSNVQTVASTTAALIDPDLHKQLRTREDETSPAYLTLEDMLRKARDANRRDGFHIKFLTTMFHADANKTIVEFGVDPEENPKDKSYLGDVYLGRMQSGGGEFELQESRSTEFIEDQWGTWLSGQAPIKDAAGNAIAVVSADMDATLVKGQLNMLLFSAFCGLALATAFAVGLALMLGRRVSKPLHKLKNALHEIGAGKYDTTVLAVGCKEFDEVGAAVNAMTAGLRERQTLKEVLARYLSRNVAESVMKSANILSLKGDRRKITVLFADIRNFTKMSDTLAPEEVVAVLNEFFEKMIDIIFKHKGTLDKFIGDGLMAVFGSPLEDPYQELNAVSAAVEMQREIQAICEKVKSRHNCELKVGIGINTGMAIVGNIGSTQRMEYTAIGDTVNLASRLEAKTKDLDSSILVSEYTYVEIRNRFATREMGSVPIRGRATPVTVFAVDSVLPVAAAA